MAKQLTITIEIDPATAVRTGHTQIGATQITLTDGDLAVLTADQRDTLARHVARDALYSEPLTSRAKPVGDASIGTLASLLDQRRAYVTAKIREAIEKISSYDPVEVDRPVPASPAVIKAYEAAGVAFSNYPEFQVKVPSGSIPCCYASGVSEVAEVSEAIHRREAELRARAEELLSFARPAADDYYATKLKRILAEAEERAAEEARVSAERESYLARLPETTRRRIEAGFSTEKEIAKLLCGLAIAESPYSQTHDERLQEGVPAAILTDSEFHQLEAVRAKAPEGARVESRHLYRPAEGTEEGDEDGDVMFRGAVVRWHFAGVRVSARIPFLDRQEVA